MTERNDFLRYTQRQASLAPGGTPSVVAGFSRGNYGAFKPHTINGLAVTELLATPTTAICALGGQQIAGKNRIEWWFLGANNLLINPIFLNWSVGDNRYQVSNAELRAFLEANFGNALKMRTIAKNV